MAERIFVDRDEERLSVPARVLADLHEHARETHPEECCGLVLGRLPTNLERVVRCRNEMTRLHRQDPAKYPRDGREAFHMNEADVLQAQKFADAEGWRVTGVYHSHADAGPYFSTLDQEFAAQDGFPFPDAMHIVISVLEGMVKEVAAFARDESPAGFTGRLLAAEAPQ
ncbi:MAG TPA: Mov34/MPN/PAD-1 family protein [Myxococcota bacterium]